MRRDRRRIQDPRDVADGVPTTTSSPAATARRPSASATPTRACVIAGSSRAPSRHAISSVSRLGGAAGSASSSVSTRPRRPRNSKRRKISFRVERSGGAETARRDRRRAQVAPHRREQLRVRACSACSRTFFAPGGRQLVGVRNDLLQRAVLSDELPGRLVADPRDPRDVVRRVALEADEVGHLAGTDPVAQLDPVGRVDVHVRDAARRHHQADVLAAELEGIAIGRDDARADARLVGARRDRRDHVVGLPPLELEVPVAERLDDRPEVRKLLAEEVGHRPPPLLVRLGDLGAVGRARVPRDADPTRLVVREQLEEHVREAEERVRRLPPGRLELLGQREVRAVGEVVAVDEEELGLLRRAVVELELLAGQRLGGSRNEPNQREVVLRNEREPSARTTRTTARRLRFRVMAR